MTVTSRSSEACAQGLGHKQSNWAVERSCQMLCIRQPSGAQPDLKQGNQRGHDFPCRG